VSNLHITPALLAILIPIQYLEHGYVVANAGVDAHVTRYTNFVPHIHGRYLSSNVNITVFNSDGESESVPVGSEFKFEISFTIVDVSSNRPFRQVHHKEVGDLVDSSERIVFILHNRGRRITSLGVIFNFTGNDVNTTVQAVADMVKEQWVCYPGRLIV
jgi:hypothetical protein